MNRFLSISAILIANIFMLMHPIILHHHDDIHMGYAGNFLHGVSYGHHSDSDSDKHHNHSRCQESNNDNTKNNSSEKKDTAQHCHLSKSHHIAYSQGIQSYSNELIPLTLDTFLLLLTIELNNEVEENKEYKTEPPPILSLEYIAQTKVLRGPPTV